MIPLTTVTATSATVTSPPDHIAAHAEIVDGELVLDGTVVCPVCLETKGSRFCACDPQVAFAAAWGEYMAAVAPKRSLAWIRMGGAA